MQSIRKVLNHIMNVLAGVSLIAMTALTCWQVFTRYVLNNPSTWSEELVGYLFAWASLFGASLITGERGHMNIPVVVELMPAAAQKFFAVFGEVIAMLFSGRRLRHHAAGHGPDDLLPGGGRGRVLRHHAHLRRYQHPVYDPEYL